VQYRSTRQHSNKYAVPSQHLPGESTDSLI